MRSWFWCFAGLLLLLMFFTGCTGTEGTEKPVTKADPTISSLASIPTTTVPAKVSLSPDSTSYRCPRPKLVFNDSQEITRIRSLDYSSPFENTSPRPGLVPLGGVVYRAPGFTRIFDSNGNQILFVNDTESIEGTPGGLQMAACVHRYIPNMKFVDENESIQNIYVADNDTCIVSIIYAGGSCFKPEIH